MQSLHAALQEQRAVLTAATESANAAARLQSALQQQLAELKQTNVIQHEQLVGVRADLCAVCAQLEASKSLPAAVAKQVQALGLRTVTVVERESVEALPNDSTESKSGGHGKVSQFVCFGQSDPTLCTACNDFNAVG